MRICILMGSPKKKGNTATFIKPFVEELSKLDCEVDYITLYDKHIEPCIGCKTCQNILDRPGCIHKDDMEIIYESVSKSDCIIFATPIYSWYCTPPMKAALDRLVYGMNKYYGNKGKSSLWKGKKCGIIVTCGYRIESGVGPFEEGIKYYAKHSKLEYLGKIAYRDIGAGSNFESEEAMELAVSFAHKVYDSIKVQEEGQIL